MISKPLITFNLLLSDKNTTQIKKRLSFRTVFASTRRFRRKCERHGYVLAQTLKVTYASMDVI